MATIDTVVIGGSAGGVEALLRLVRLLPADIPASLFVVNHFPEKSRSVLPHILTNAGIPAEHGEDGAETLPGRIYVAPPGRHMLLGPSTLRLTRGPKEHSTRPAIDPLFRSAAQSRGRRVVSVLLSGFLDDGTLGSLAVQQAGGTTLALDPAEAQFGDMPSNAIQAKAIDHVESLVGIAKGIVALAGKPVEIGSLTE